jgi:chorismate mutase
VHSTESNLECFALSSKRFAKAVAVAQTQQMNAVNNIAKEENLLESLFKHVQKLQTLGRNLVKRKQVKTSK